MNATNKMLKTLQPRPQVQSPIASDMFIPNLSGITSNVDAKRKLDAQYLRNDGDTASGTYTFNSLVTIADPSTEADIEAFQLMNVHGHRYFLAFDMNEIDAPKGTIQIGDVDNAGDGTKLFIDMSTSFILLQNARVGIGTANPLCLLDVGDVGESSVFGVKYVSGYTNIMTVQDNSGDNLMQISGSPNNPDDLIKLGDVSGVGNGEVFTIDGINSQFTFELGNVGIKTNAPTASLDINADLFRLRTAKTPASASATGTVGSICWSSGYIYVCVAANTWKRVAIATW